MVRRVKGKSFCMQLELRCHKLIIYTVLYIYIYEVLCKLHGNHIAKTYSRYTEVKKKGIKADHYRKSSIYKESKRRRTNKGTKKHPENNKMALVSPYLSIVTLNVNEPNSQVNRHRAVEWIKRK